MALSRDVSEIFNVEKCGDLEIVSEVTQRHWKRYHSIYWVWFPICVLLKLCPKTHVFEMFDFKNVVTLKTGLGSVKVIADLIVR